MLPLILLSKIALFSLGFVTSFWFYIKIYQNFQLRTLIGVNSSLMFGTHLKYFALSKYISKFQSYMDIILPYFI